MRSCTLRPARRLAQRLLFEVELLRAELGDSEEHAQQAGQMAEAAEMHVLSLREQLGQQQQQRRRELAELEGSSSSSASARAEVDKLREQLGERSRRVERLEAELAEAQRLRREQQLQLESERRLWKAEEARRARDEAASDENVSSVLAKLDARGSPAIQVLSRELEALDQLSANIATQVRTRKRQAGEWADDAAAASDGGGGRGRGGRGDGSRVGPPVPSPSPRWPPSPLRPEGTSRGGAGAPSRHSWLDLSSQAEAEARAEMAAQLAAEEAAEAEAEAEEAAAAAAAHAEVYGHEEAAEAAAQAAAEAVAWFTEAERRAAEEEAAALEAEAFEAEEAAIAAAEAEAERLEAAEAERLEAAEAERVEAYEAEAVEEVDETEWSPPPQGVLSPIRPVDADFEANLGLAEPGMDYDAVASAMSAALLASEAALAGEWEPPDECRASGAARAAALRGAPPSHPPLGLRAAGSRAPPSFEDVSEAPVEAPYEAAHAHAPRPGRQSASELQTRPSQARPSQSAAEQLLAKHAEPRPVPAAEALLARHASRAAAATPATPATCACVSPAASSSFASYSSAFAGCGGVRGGRSSDQVSLCRSALAGATPTEAAGSGGASLRPAAAAAPPIPGRRYEEILHRGGEPPAVGPRSASGAPMTLAQRRAHAEKLHAERKLSSLPPQQRARPTAQTAGAERASPAMRPGKSAVAASGGLAFYA